MAMITTYLSESPVFDDVSEILWYPMTDRCAVQFGRFRGELFGVEPFGPAWLLHSSTLEEARAIADAMKKGNWYGSKLAKSEIVSWPTRDELDEDEKPTKKDRHPSVIAGGVVSVQVLDALGHSTDKIEKKEISNGRSIEKD